MTNNQLQALTDLRNDEWKYGIKIQGRHSLTSLHKLRLVDRSRGKRGLMQWKITEQGLKLLKELTPELFEAA